jgi:hypothetical protein
MTYASFIFISKCSLHLFTASNQLQLFTFLDQARILRRNSGQQAHIAVVCWKEVSLKEERVALGFRRVLWIKQQLNMYKFEKR